MIHLKPFDQKLQRVDIVAVKLHGKVEMRPGHPSSLAANGDRFTCVHTVRHQYLRQVAVGDRQWTLGEFKKDAKFCIIICGELPIDNRIYRITIGFEVDACMELIISGYRVYPVAEPRGDL